MAVLNLNPMSLILPEPAEDCTTLTPFRIGCDWLTLSMSAPRELFDMEGATPWKDVGWWRRTEHTTPVMQRVFVLEDPTGEKLATVSAVPWSLAIGSADWVLVQFANRTLYQLPSWRNIYDAFRAAGFRYHAISRIDIAADMLEDSGGDVMQPIKRTWQGDARYYGRAKWTPTLSGRDNIDSVYLGTRRSNKFFRVYCKSRELKTPGAAHKASYISAAWADALGGFDPMANGATVNRFEVQLKGKEVRRYFPEEVATDSIADRWVHSLADPERLASMFGSMAQHTYDFRTVADRARDARAVVRWDLSQCVAGFELRDRAPRTQGISDRAMKGMLKNAWRAAYLRHDVFWIDKVIELANGAGLTRWLDRWIPEWEKECEHLLDNGDIMGHRLARNVPITPAQCAQNDPT